MPTYLFACKRDHVEEKFLPMNERDAPQKCSVCHRQSKRRFAAFGISGEHTIKQLYQYEQDQWALATGVKHRTAGEIADWAKANGKTILNNKESVRPVDHNPSEREVEKTLEKIHSQNFNAGEIR